MKGRSKWYMLYTTVGVNASQGGSFPRVLEEQLQEQEPVSSKNTKIPDVEGKKRFVSATSPACENSS